jgi:hypothetical protein
MDGRVLDRLGSTRRKGADFVTKTNNQCFQIDGNERLVFNDQDSHFLAPSAEEYSTPQSNRLDDTLFPAPLQAAEQQF